MYKDIFISYSSKDENYVRQVVELFKLNDISYWFAPEQLVGKKHDEEIVPAIKNCKIFLIFLSENSRPREGFATSQWVRDELLTAREYKCFIQPIKLDYTVDQETNNLMYKGLPNYLDMTINPITVLKDLIITLLKDDNYKNKENTLENIFESKATKLLSDIEKNLQNGSYDQSKDILDNNRFLYDFDFEYCKLIEAIVMMSSKPIKDMDIVTIKKIVQLLIGIESPKYSNIVCYLKAMIAKSYFEFNGVRNNLTESYIELKKLSKKLPRLKSKYYQMTRNIQNIMSAKEFEFLWI